MANLGQFRNRVALKIGLDNSPDSIEQVEIDSWINEAIRDILMETQVYVVEGVANFTSGTSDYTLDSKILDIKDVFITSDGINYTLDKVSPDAIIQYRRGQNVATGPARYYAVNGANNIMVWPIPGSSDTMTFWYVPRPIELVNASDDPSDSSHGGIPTEWHKGIESYALWQAGDYADDSSSQNGLTYQQLYEKWLLKIKKERSRKGGRRLGAIVAGRRKRPFAPHDPSTDTNYIYG